MLTTDLSGPTEREPLRERRQSLGGWPLKVRLIRRLIVVTGSIALLLAAVVVANGRGRAPDTPSPPVAPRVVEPYDVGVARRVAGRYGVAVVWEGLAFPVTTGYGPIGGKAAGPRELQRYFPIFADEFLRYPPELVRRGGLGLKRVVLCRDLTFDGLRRGAIPDYEHDTLYLDVARGGHSETYQRLVIHHEFFHLFDYWDDGLVYGDDAWGRLNPEAFLYGKGGVSMQDDPRSSLSVITPGFLSAYATSGVEEDKAEVFAHLMTEYRAVTGRAARDGVLAAKVARLKALLRAFCPAMDEAYWEEVGRR